MSAQNWGLLILPKLPLFLYLNKLFGKSIVVLKVGRKNIDNNSLPDTEIRGNVFWSGYIKKNFFEGKKD